MMVIICLVNVLNNRNHLFGKYFIGLFIKPYVKQWYEASIAGTIIPLYKPHAARLAPRKVT